MPSYTRVHNSYIKVNNCKKKTFWDQNLSFSHVVWVFRFGNYGFGVGVLGLGFEGYGWVDCTYTHTFYKFTH